jgi:hypothetical protein
MGIAMNDLSHIGRPGANQERAVCARRGHIPLQLSALKREMRADDYFRAGGFAQPLEKAQSGQGNPRVFL